jgi:polysaccharide export outer membrane protein
MRSFETETGFGPTLRALCRLLAIAFLSAALAACALAGSGGGRSKVAYNPDGFVKPDTATVAVAPGSQAIGVGDKITVAVFQVPDLSGEFQVDAAGNISMPLIGSVAAQGKTSTELARHLEQRLGATYLRDPNVQVAIKEATPQNFTVDGSVRNPGVFPLQGQTSLIKAIAQANGTAEDADPSRVVVFRQINGQRMAAAFNLAAIRRGNAEDPTIYGNDIIVVDGARGRALYKELLQAFPLFAIFQPF